MALTLEIYLITNGLRDRQVRKCFPNSFPNSINSETAAGFVQRSAVSST
jgi:hypothetical protein